MKKLLIIALLIVGCEEILEPEDCAGVAGGTAGLDSCAVCIGGTTNLTACVQDCNGDWGGDGIDLDSDNICDNIDSCIGVIDECGECGGYDNNNDNRCQIDLNVLNDFININESLSGVALDVGSQIWNNNRLIHLTIDNASLEYLPQSIDDLYYLTFLGLWTNNLSGEIPSAIGNLSYLTELELSENQFTGSIPDIFYNLTNLELFYLGRNNLTGEIKSAIGNLNNLEQIWLGENNLSGEIPIELWNIESIEGIWLEGNNFEGNIPSSIGNLTKLRHLYLSDNGFFGVIPDEICDLSLPYNNLDSTYTWNNEIWKYFKIDNNNFCPPYPECIEDYMGEQDTSNCD